MCSLTAEPTPRWTGGCSSRTSAAGEALRLAEHSEQPLAAVDGPTRPRLRRANTRPDRSDRVVPPSCRTRRHRRLHMDRLRLPRRAVALLALHGDPPQAAELGLAQIHAFRRAGDAGRALASSAWSSPHSTSSRIKSTSPMSSPSMPPPLIAPHQGSVHQPNCCQSSERDREHNRPRSSYPSHRSRRAMNERTLLEHAIHIMEHLVR